MTPHPGAPTGAHPLHRPATVQSGIMHRMKAIDLPLRCPCCRLTTLSRRAAFEICPVCFWEDDGQDEHNAAEVCCGPNGDLSLTQGRLNYQSFGASSREGLPHVRAPRPEERRRRA